MNFKQWLLVILSSMFLVNGCQSTLYETLPDGIFITLTKRSDNDPTVMKLHVLGEGIIRVVAAPQDTFSTRPSLIVERTSWPQVSWSVKESDGQIILSTSKLTVKVNPETGATAFYDASGALLLKEKENGGKVITPAVVMDEETYHAQQLFDSPADEAFYGLGQHQNDIMNWKGHDVDLWQYNLVAVVPFLVSSNHYGILWDNNSWVKFGDTRFYGPLSQLKLYGNDNSEGGLTAEYFNTSIFENPTITRSESDLDYRFEGDFSAKGPQGYRSGRGGVRWSGYLEAKTPGVHKFQLYSAGYTKLWLNDELIVDSWRQNWLPWTHLFKLNMEAGKRYPITIEWREASYFGLQCLTPDPSQDENALSLWSEVADQIDYYFIYGETMDTIIKGYREVTGQAPMMPKWSMGLFQSRQRYNTQKELLDVSHQFRERRIPVDVMVQDWFYWKEDKWGDHEFDPVRWPDPDSLINDLHGNDFHFMISVWPKFYKGTKNFDIFNEKGWLYPRNIELNTPDWVGYVSTFYDPYNKPARELFWEQINDKLFSKGIDSWWLDATEPEPYSNASETERRLRIGPTALGTSARYLNTFSLMNSKGIYEGQRAADPNKRVFILTRSAFAGQQRYASATWSGDIAARWYDLKAQIPAGINFSLSGIPWWTTDIGGFSVESKFSRTRGRTDEDTAEWREFMTRWFQFGAFCPLFRVHGEAPYREIFETAPDDHPAYQAMVAYDKLRYRLMPYIYSLNGMVTHQGYTVMRGLVMDFPDDINARNIGDQYLFGPSLLVNPVYDYKVRSRQVYLPAGTGWYEFKSGRYLTGGQTVQADAPYSDIPLFVREGSIIPFGPEIQYTDEKPANPIRLVVYTGKDGSFSLYEDENTNYNYEKGAYSWIPFTYSESTQTLTIGTCQGEYPGMLRERSFEVVWVSKDSPTPLDLDGASAQTVAYRGEELKVTRH